MYIPHVYADLTPLIIFLSLYQFINHFIYLHFLPLKLSPHQIMSLNSLCIDLSTIYVLSIFIPTQLAFYLPIHASIYLYLYEFYFHLYIFIYMYTLLSIMTLIYLPFTYILIYTTFYQWFYLH